MADTSPSFSTKSPSKKSPNVSSGWVVMVLSGLIAVVIFFVVTNQSGTKQQVLVAAHDIAPGDTISASSFRVAQVNVSQNQLSRMIGSTDENRYNGNIAVGPIKSGDVVQKTEMVSPPKDGLRYMSIPIDKSHAVNGSITAGDRVDVIDEGPSQPAGSGPPVFEASNIEVVTVYSSGGSTGITANNSAGFVVTVSVTPDQALGISLALKDGKLDIVRSTGAKALVSGLSPNDNDASTTSTTVAP